MHLQHTAENASIAVNGCSFAIAGDSYAAFNGCNTATITVDGSTAIPTAIAYIDYNNGYAYSFVNIDDAFAYAKNGETIVLLANVNLDTIEVNANVTVNTNGFTFNVTNVTGTGSVTVA